MGLAVAIACGDDRFRPLGREPAILEGDPDIADVFSDPVVKARNLVCSGGSIAHDPVGELAQSLGRRCHWGRSGVEHPPKCRIGREGAGLEARDAVESVDLTEVSLPRIVFDANMMDDPVADTLLAVFDVAHRNAQGLRSGPVET